MPPPEMLRGGGDVAIANTACLKIMIQVQACFKITLSKLRVIVIKDTRNAIQEDELILFL